MSDYRDRLQSLMDKVGMNRMQLATALGISYQAIYKLFDKNGRFGVANNQKAAEYFCVSSDWLATGKGTETPTQSSQGISSGAMEIAALYDLIPVSDRIRRAQAYNKATVAIMEVLERHASAVQATDLKTQ